MSRVLKDATNQITCPYGYKGHVGVDVVKYKGQLAYIIAHTEGTVIEVVKNYNRTDKTGHSYGNYVLLRHPNGYYTLYAHMKYGSVKVSKGQWVDKGQTIGYMGNTGYSQGAHLHFEVRNTKDQKINPTQYLNSDLPSNGGYTGIITYQVYTNKWLPSVNKCDNTDEGYAGTFGVAITGIKAKPQYGEITIQSHIKGGKWLTPISSKDFNSKGDNSYSGILGKSIDGVKIKSSKGFVDYRVHIKNGKWLAWVNSKTSSGSESFAGLLGKEIDGIQMK